MNRHVLFILAPLILSLGACGGGGSPIPSATTACGWDLTSEAGRQASQDRLTFVNEWLLSNPGVAPPSPSSTYWHGECPTPSTSVPPPDHEDEAPDN